MACLWTKFLILKIKLVWFSLGMKFSHESRIDVEKVGYGMVTDVKR